MPGISDCSASSREFRLGGRSVSFITGASRSARATRGRPGVRICSTIRGGLGDGSEWRDISRRDGDLGSGLAGLELEGASIERPSDGGPKACRCSGFTCTLS